jgi:gluconokinase
VLGDVVKRKHLALGIDLGTGSARAFLYDAAGRRSGGVRLRYTWQLATDGTVEVDADDVVELTLDAVDGALASLPRNARVVGVGFSGLWHTILGVDDAGRPATRVLGWNDTRATSAARALRASLDAEAVHQRTGALLHPSYPPARIAWLRANRPEQFTSVTRWLSLPEYVWLRLTGEHVCDVSMAAGSGLLDRRALDWDAALCAALDVAPDQLGRIVTGADAVVSGSRVTCTGDHAERHWAQLRDAQWRTPVGDGACANYGSGCTDASRMALSMGTSAALRVLTTGRDSGVPRGLWCYALDPQRALLGGAISNGGLVRSWLRSLLHLPSDDPALDALLESRPPAAHGLTLLPFLTGERSPDWPLDATAAITGLSAATSPLDILQAGMEAVAYRLLLVRRLLAAAEPDALTIVASGGAIRQSGFWAQLVADVFGEAVSVANDGETSSRGAALLGLHAAGEIADLGAVPAGVTIREPDPARHAAHEQALQHHLELAARLA